MQHNLEVCWSFTRLALPDMIPCASPIRTRGGKRFRFGLRNRSSTELSTGIAILSNRPSSERS